MLDLEQRMRIEEEERLRIRIRQDQEKMLLRKQASDDSTIASHQQYVDEHGRAGAFKWTVKKWSSVGLIMAYIEYRGSDPHESYWAALGDASIALLIFSAIGVWRGFKILSSSR